MQAARKKAKLRRHTAERKASAAAAAAAGFPADGAGRGLADDIPVTVKTSWFMKVISSVEARILENC